MHNALQVIQSYGGSIDAESSKMMPYADASIKEGLRLTAVAGFAARVALKSFEIGSYTIPKVRSPLQMQLILDLLLHCSLVTLACLSLALLHV